MPDDPAAQTEELRRSIALLEEQQRKFGLGLAAQIAAQREKLAQLIQSGGVSADGNLQAGGDVVGQDKIDNSIEVGNLTGNIGAAIGHNAQSRVTQTAGTGPQAAVNEVHGNLIVGLSPEAEAERRVAEARRRYLTGLRRQCLSLPLAAMGEEEGAEAGVTLDDVYIDLDTQTPTPLTEDEKQKHDARREKSRLRGVQESDTRPLTAMEAARQSPRLVLLGNPGAGKSTFVYRLLAWLAMFQLGQDKPLPEGLPGDLLPMLIVLRDLAPRLAALKLDGLPDDRRREVLAAAVCEQAVADLERLDAAAFAEGLGSTLRAGGCLLAFDGLDEVPHDVRGLVRQAIAAVIARYVPPCLIVTCRVRSYEGEARLPNFDAHTLAPFGEEKIKTFVQGWYTTQNILGRVDTVQARRKADDLARAALSPDLRELSENPMLLTTMALIHQREIGLPSQRVQLYSLAVDVLLRRWQKGKTGALAEFLKDNLRLRAVMERLAYEAHRLGKGEKQAADIARGESLTLLEAPEYLGSPGLAAEFLDYVDQRAGLLVGRGGDPARPLMYSFPHRTFQEYLAGCYLLSGRDSGRQAREFFAHAGEGDYWNLAARLAAEELRYNVPRGVNQLLDLAYRLCPANEPAHTQAWRAIVWAGVMAALAGREAIERDTDSPDGGPPYLERLRLRLAALLGSDPSTGSGHGLAAQERAEAGRALAVLGDPRAGVGPVIDHVGLAGKEIRLWGGRPKHAGLPDIVWLPVEGVRKYKLVTDEGDKGTYDISPFYIAKYPVTYAQFQVFIDDPEGFKNPRWWDGLAAGDEQKSQPGEQCFKFDNHPRETVSWYDVIAFCRWLNARLGWPDTLRALNLKAQNLGDYTGIRLPTEWEWQWTATGGRRDYEYPWGPEWDETKANTGESRLNGTTAVVSEIKITETQSREKRLFVQR